MTYEVHTLKPADRPRIDLKHAVRNTITKVVSVYCEDFAIAYLVYNALEETEERKRFS